MNNRHLLAGDKAPVGATLTLVIGNGEREAELDGDSIDVVEGAAETGTESSADDSWF